MAAAVTIVWTVLAAVFMRDVSAAPGVTCHPRRNGDELRAKR